jgi:hypothetical protein
MSQKGPTAWGAILAGLLAVLGGGYYVVKRLLEPGFSAIQVRTKTVWGLSTLPDA